MTKEQQQALDVVAKHFGWDKLSMREVELLAWAAFHYLVMRLNQR
jgi:hypothetical protein